MQVDIKYEELPDPEMVVYNAADAWVTFAANAKAPNGGSASPQAASMHADQMMMEWSRRFAPELIRKGK
jgi:hypothetical protein